MMQASTVILLIIALLLFLTAGGHPALQRILTVCILAMLLFLGVIINKRTNEMKLNEHSLFTLNEELAKANEELERSIAVRRDVETALRESGQRLGTILDSLRTGVMIVDSERREIVDVNPAALAMIGAPKDKVLGSVCHTFVCPADAGGCPVADHKQRIDHSERVLVNARGEKIPILKTVVQIEIHDRPHLLESFIDITDLKKTQEDLKCAKDSAEAANIAKSQFLANMSHEIRTPMIGVLGMTELLLGTPLTETQRHFAKTAHWSGQALLCILDDILDYSRIEAGRLKLDPIDFTLSRVVEDVLDLLAPGAHSKGLEVSCMLCENRESTLWGDPGRLRQILTNILGNAIKFTEHGDVVLRVSAVEDTPETVLIRFSVEDSGVGIVQDRKERIFEAFTQGDPTLTRKHGGAGLGLSIVKGLVGMMGGELGCESAPGQGSTFWFTVRFEKRHAEGGDALEPLPVFKGRSVLIMDDNETSRDILRHYVTSWGMTADEAPDAARALDLIRAASSRGGRYDVALIDHPMPAGNGHASEQELRSCLDRSGTRQVLMIPLGTAHHCEEGRDPHPHRLSKPLRRSALYMCLKRMLTSGNEHAKNLVESVPDAGESQGHVLIAEDNPINQEVTYSILEALGIEATVVSNGREAVEALSKSPYSAVLMDCQMPEMDGLAATQAIRDREIRLGLARTPIIAITASAFARDRELCLAAGMDDYVSKPFSVDQLQAVLDRWMLRTETASAKTDLTPQGTTR